MGPDKFKEYAQIHLDVTKQSFGVELDYDEASILKLDDLIQKAWPEQPPAQIDNVILLFGSFLGEAMIRVLGGQWVETEQGWGVQIGNATIMVFTKVKRRLLNGMEDSISYYYKSLEQMMKNDFKDIVN